MIKGGGFSGLRRIAGLFGALFLVGIYAIPAYAHDEPNGRPHRAP